MRIFRRVGWWAIAAVLVLPGSVRAADKPAVVYTPKSRWNVHYANDSCRLGRSFTQGENEAILVFDQFEPGPGLYIVAAGKRLKGYAVRGVTGQFGPAGSESKLDHSTSAEFGAYGPAISFGEVPLLRRIAEANELATWDASASPILAPTPEEESAITWFEIRQGSRAPIRFALGSMHKVMEAMRACTDELLTHWGIDAAAHRTLSRRAHPAENPGNWVSSNDYPTDLLAKGVQGTIQFRLAIDETGKVSSCHIQQSTRPAEFDKTVCKIMSRRARFNHALDATGKPIKSYWRSSFRFIMP